MLMKSRIALSYVRIGFIPVMYLMLIFAGCEVPGEIPLNRFEDAQAYFREVMLNDEFFRSEENILDDGDADEISKSGALPSDDRIYPRRFGRIVASIEREFEYELRNDTLAVVTMIRTITGTFKILYATESIRLISNGIVEKPLIETNKRRAMFLKVADTGIPENDWRMVAVSMVNGGTEERNFKITSVNIKFRSQDTPARYELPTEKFFRIGFGNRDIQRVDFDPNGNVRTGIEVTIVSSYTSSDEREEVFLRHGGGMQGPGASPGLRTGLQNRARMALVSETDRGNGTYERTYATEWLPGLYRGKVSSIIEVLSNGTLHSSSAAVESNYWGVPFIVQ